MNNPDLWQGRFTAFIIEMQKYLKYIFNGHLLFVLLIAAGGLGYYYSEWVKDLGSDFPAALIMCLIIGFAAATSPIFTFLKEADMIFLLPLETKLKSYFSRSITLSLFMQSFILLVLFAVLMPMYSKVSGASLKDFAIIFVFLIVLKYVNLMITWHVLKFQEKSTILTDAAIRYILNAAVLYLVFSGAGILFPLIAFILLIALMLYYRSATIRKPLKWEKLIELEDKRMMSFYRIANLFTDVPKLRGKTARRKWLDWLLKFIPYNQNSAYSYLYARTFLRANDYIGLLLRLTVIGSVVLLAFISVWANILVIVIFLYMTGIQLLPAWKQHEMKIWVSLYPLPAKMRETAVIKMAMYFLIFENLIFFLVKILSGAVVSSLVSFAAGFVFISIFRAYAVKKIRKF
ncbi:ABC-2 type transport system permease protein [Bacillus sp. OV322]|uniref:ABC transporter permease n=1 Tax=Bacillus sp. OV322 TaxID=1882764 RepID=UPI0008DFD91C|nr:ABC transporter permease [Bacillus sp. OV322]SFB95712.1 ABC-2 type transport system permease protein [Bacillus sp. OV322]